jgi:hypothetical protein
MDVRGLQTCVSTSPDFSNVASLYSLTSIALRAST